MTDETFGEGGSRQDNVRDILCGGGASGTSVWVIDLGNDPLAGEIPRVFLPPGGTADGGHGTQTATGWNMGVPTHWGGSGKSGDG